jgi:hypothetical protein
MPIYEEARDEAPLDVAYEDISGTPDEGKMSLKKPKPEKEEAPAEEKKEEPPKEEPPKEEKPPAKAPAKKPQKEKAKKKEEPPQEPPKEEQKDLVGESADLGQAVIDMKEEHKALDAKLTKLIETKGFKKAKIFEVIEQKCGLEVKAKTELYSIEELDMLIKAFSEE